MQYLEAGLDIDWNLYSSGGRDLDPIKIERYLNMLPDEYLNAARFILNNTEYVSFDNFKKNLQKSFDLFRNSIGNEVFYLVYPTQGKIGSENWFTHMLYPQIRKLNMIGVLDINDNVLDTIPSESHIVLIDDAIYSGCNMAGTIDNMSYPCIKNKTFNFHFIVPYTRKGGRDTICTSVPAKSNFYSIIEMEDTNDDACIEKFNNDLGSEGDPVAIYFDWKVANNFGSYPQLYLEGALPQQNFNYKNNLIKTGTLLKILPTRECINRVINLIESIDVISKDNSNQNYNLYINNDNMISNDKQKSYQ
ncbi:hypothetical protein D3C87_929540 [compost metagenome]